METVGIGESYNSPWHIKRKGEKHMTVREYICALEDLAAQYGDDTPVRYSWDYGNEDADAPYYQPSNYELHGDYRLDCIMINS
jgi:hypothetical protein